MKKYFILLWLVAVSVPLIKLWQGVAIPELPPIAPPILAPPLPTSSKEILTNILGHNLWDKQRGQILEPKREQTGIATAASDSAPVDTDWQLKGIVMPNEVYLKTGKKLKQYHQYDQLPDGAILHNILIDGIVIEKNEEKHNVYLFGKKP